MKIQFWARTDVGRKRSHNEDNFLVDKKLNLYVVCDGMGGHASGEVASATAVKEVHEKISANRDIIEKYSRGEDGVDAEDIHTLLEHAVQYACFKIYDMGQKDKKKRGMGTTLSLLLVAGNRGFYAHVGDSRIYLIRDADVTQVTRDHSLLNELIERGKIKSEQDIKFPFKNAVTRAVGVFETVDVDTATVEIEEGDYVLICSDGLHGYFEEVADLRRLLAANSPEQWVDKLVDSANEQGGKDNITAVMVKLLTPVEAEAYESRQRKVETLKMIPLFKYLTQKELDRVIEVTSHEEFVPETVLFQEGDEGDSLFVVLSGQVEIRKGDVVLASLSTGLHFGEMSLIDKVPRSAQARTITKVETLRFTRDRFFDLLRNDSTLAVKLLWSFVRTLSARLRSTSDELAMVRAIQAEESLDDSLMESIPGIRRQVVAAKPPSPPELAVVLDGGDEFDDEEVVEDEEELETDDVEGVSDNPLIDEIAAVLAEHVPPTPPGGYELDPFASPEQAPPAAVEALSEMVHHSAAPTEEIPTSDLIDEDGPPPTFALMVDESAQEPPGTDALTALTELVEQERQSVDDSIEELLRDNVTAIGAASQVTWLADGESVHEEVEPDPDDALENVVVFSTFGGPDLTVTDDRPLATDINDATVPDIAPVRSRRMSEAADDRRALEHSAETVTLPGAGLDPEGPPGPVPSVPVFGNALMDTQGGRSRKRRAGASTLPYIFIGDLEKAIDESDDGETTKK